MEQHTENKSIIRDFYRRALGQGDVDFAQQVIAEDYIQHSPMANIGKSGVLEALQYLKKMPKPVSTTKPFMRLIAEGDFVVTNLRFDWGGKQKVVVDLYRVHQGQVTEHWDAVQDEPESTHSGHPMMDGAVDIQDIDLTEENKQMAIDFYQRAFVERKMDVLSDFVAIDLIQHSPEIADGLLGLQTYLTQQTCVCSIRKVHRVIAEGDFVVFQSEGELDQQPFVFYDIFRVKNKKIVEQWEVKQMIPATMPHENGMI